MSVHQHTWRRAGPLLIRKGGVRESCACGARRLRRLVRCPDCAEARTVGRYLYSARYDADPEAPPCETCAGRGWVDAVKPDPQTLCCCYRLADKAAWCGSCTYKTGAMALHYCELLMAEEDAAYRARQADALLDPKPPMRVIPREQMAQAEDIGS